ncbi:class II fructose-bisphosphatase [bacterium]|nr:class II fructose-bisphosphatase [bacterium]
MAKLPRLPINAVSAPLEISTRLQPDESLLALELLPVVEQAAIESAKFMGCGDRNAADMAAVAAMRRALDSCNIDGTVVIGEGERDEAPMLYIGERVGNGNSQSKLDIAVDPLEGTNLCANGANNAIAVMAISEEGGLLHAPDIYMQKLIVPPRAAGKCDLDAPAAANCMVVAKCLERDIRELVVVVLDRPRHKELIKELRLAGVRIKLIPDGDLSAAIAAVVQGTGVHMVMGIGGAPEGVLSAAAVKCLGGEILARLKPKDEAEHARCIEMGVDPDKVYGTDGLAPGERIVFVASGVTPGDLLDGVRFFGHGVRVNSVVMTYASMNIRFTDSIHLTERRQVPVTRV